ncbi:hypothetical protein F0562_003505 [Nyssa sinensis]|uniref:Uncharacterized protein n=1 Tax=Nyssa sinensis TaxID=561372 RepID=A0A5J5BWP7_9ASTE|nr:hypothetical protein F0562_003505 [Nyssa sinensis]
MSNQEEKNNEFNFSNSIDAEGNSGESNNEVDNVEIEDDSEPMDPKASHFTLEHKGYTKLTDDQRKRLQKVLKLASRVHNKVLSVKNLVKVGLIQALGLDFRKQVLSRFRPLRKKRVAIGDPTSSTKRLAIGDSSFSERTRMEENVQDPEAFPSQAELLEPPIAGDTNVAGTPIPLSRRRGKEGKSRAEKRNLGSDIGGRYEYRDLEAQLQVHLMSSIEVANKIEELKNKLDDTEMELGTAPSHFGIQR